MHPRPVTDEYESPRGFLLLLLFLCTTPSRPGRNCAPRAVRSLPQGQERPEREKVLFSDLLPLPLPNSLTQGSEVGAATFPVGAGRWVGRKWPCPLSVKPSLDLSRVLSLSQVLAPVFRFCEFLLGFQGDFFTFIFHPLHCIFHFAYVKRLLSFIFPI